MNNLPYSLVVSPMAGITDAPFRYLAIQNGANYGISEMITSQTHLWNSEKTQQRLRSHFTESPKIIQIAGASPQVIAEAAQLCFKEGADALEINMGCPAKKVCNVLAGSALLRDESLVATILQAAVNAVPIPVYLKTRLGWDHDNKNILQIAKLAEGCGVQSLAIHGRTRSDMYNGGASYDLIGKVKSQLRIPVFANGDITTPEVAREVLLATKADGLYIGRGALGQPWLFQQIRDYLDKGNYEVYAQSEIMEFILNHVRLIHQHYGEPLGVFFARKHVKWYLKANPTVFVDNPAKLANFLELETPELQLEAISSWS